jgi:hypothetical protein
MLTVTNNQRTLHTLNLPRGKDFGANLQPSQFSMRQIARDRDGTAGVRVYEAQLPASITWLPWETKAGLPDSLLEVPEFLRDARAGKLSYTKTDQT